MTLREQNSEGNGENTILTKYVLKALVPTNIDPRPSAPSNSSVATDVM